jgi:hypothetical protein
MTEICGEMGKGGLDGGGEFFWRYEADRRLEYSIGMAVHLAPCRFQRAVQTTI